MGIIDFSHFYLIGSRMGRNGIEFFFLYFWGIINTHCGIGAVSLIRNNLFDECEFE